MKSLRALLVTYAGVMPSMLMLVGFLVLPLAIILVFSFLTPGPYGGVEPQVSVAAYVKLFFQKDLYGDLTFNSSVLEIAFRSVKIAAISVLGCVLLGAPVAYYIAQQPKRRRNTLLLLITIPFWTNLLIRTYSWIIILRDNGLVNNFLISANLTEAPVKLLYTEGSVVIGLVYTYVPFMILPIYAALERLDAGLIEAARDLYASKWRSVTSVVIPLAAPGFTAGSILVFIPCLGTFVAPELLGGGKHLMLGSLVQMQFAAGRNWPYGSALAMMIMAVVLVCLTIFALNARKTGGGMQH
ncbi:ABC transporter permease [Celeribacter naphthalenivorans]|uniref:ABC transporter permease n=1 Tax=Celeribacter naphthalenivorans TaxID=1614694 RepID=UPI001CFB6E5C|nr:ABC transporter permease [Celeribacter naphthalenivorans]